MCCRVVQNEYTFFIFTPQISHQRHHDADIPDRGLRQGWLDRDMYRHVSRSTESSKYKDSSSDSDQSSDSSSEESRSSEGSSKEVDLTTQATTFAVTTMTTDSMITSTMTDVTTGGRSTITPQTETDNTDKPIERETTPLAGTTSTSIPESSTSVTHCVTRDIPTDAPITDNRGDN